MYETIHEPSPGERALELNSEICDLRNRLLFERIGREGMEALAERNAADDLFSRLESAMTPESAALALAIETQEHDEMGRDVFGRNFDDLDPVEKERVRQGSRASRESVNALEADGTSALARAEEEGKQLDVELNRVFNTPVLTTYKYEGARQSPGEVVIYDDKPTSILPLPVEGVSVMPQVKVHKVDGVVRASLMLAAIDSQTHLPLDLLRTMRDDPGVSEEDIHQIDGWLSQGIPFEGLDELVTHLENVRAYLYDHLDPNTQSQRIEWSPEEPKA